MAGHDKKWDFDQYEWSTRDYDDCMRSTERLHYDEMLSRVLEKASINNGEIVLDIGTGTGNLAVRFVERGCEVIEKFLSEAKTYLKADGAILLIYSTLTGLNLSHVEESYRVEALEELPIFFEKLFCLLLRPITPF